MAGADDWQLFSMHGPQQQQRTDVTGNAASPDRKLVPGTHPAIHVYPTALTSHRWLRAGCSRSYARALAATESAAPWGIQPPAPECAFCGASADQGRPAGKNKSGLACQAAPRVSVNSFDHDAVRLQQHPMLLQCKLLLTTRNLL